MSGTDTGDEALDQFLLSGVVERVVHAGLDRLAGETSDVDAEVIGASTLSGGDVGSRFRFELFDFLREPQTPVFEQRRRLGIGFGEEPTAFTVDIAERGPNAGGICLGLRA